MTRREFITLLGGAAVAWPLAARAQQPKRVRLIGALMPSAADDLEGQARIRTFVQALQQLGWSDGHNIRIDTRWAAGNPNNIVKYATELVALAPDVILAGGTPTLGPLLRATRTVPIVFTYAADPVAAGFTDSLARPGGNVTGFTSSGYSMSGKWLQLLKQIAPNVARVAVLRDSNIPTGPAEFGIINPINIRDAGEIERGIATFARSANGGLIVTGSALALLHRDLIITLAARHKVPAVYYDRFFVTGGGLMSYGPRLVDQYRFAADYINRILKGAKPADLPVQASTKYELAINLKTAKALGIEIPPTLLARADEVIE